MRQAYDYWQDQPGNCLFAANTSAGSLQPNTSWHRIWHVPCTSQWDCACHSTGLDFALLRTEHHTPVCNPFTQASSSAWSGSWSVSRRTHTYPAATAATSSSLGSLADPGCSRTGCIQLFSQRHREITGATPLATMPRTGPVGSRVVSRSMRAAMEQTQ